ncbi:hypothetical protein [Phenylobacterium sp.]|uniref:hypothetical protein n=1 Tax=Phenylobacterium sp. TaxID=1871053 RepID=UPI0035B08F89
MLILAGLIALVATLVAIVWLIGASEPVQRLGVASPAWFVMLKGGEAPSLAPGVRLRWRSRIDAPMIADEAYWDTCLILTGGAHDADPLILGSGTVDAYIARIDLLAPPALALGVLRVLVTLGVLAKPKDAPVTDPATLGFRTDIMPTKANTEALIARPASYRPAMVNFLKYFETARYKDGRPSTGAEAYRRYGAVALQTVYRVGGTLQFYGRVRDVLREPDAGPTVGAWDDVAVMLYPNPAAIATMEQVPVYHAALHHRDAGLDRTVLLASHLA